MNLLEREDLLAELNESRAEGGRLVFVGGEAGAGKTTLVRAFVARDNARVLSGSCENLTTPIPLGPFADIAAQTEGALAELLGAGGDARRVARALLDEMSPTTVVVIEDIHWADEGTLDALRVLGRRIDGTKGIMLATYRDDEVDDEHPLRVVLGELASAPGVSRVTVPTLTVAAVRELAAPHGADAEAIHRLTQGNAFYVTEVLASGAASLPETVRDAVLARLASLGSAARRLLDVIALVPGRTELWLLESVAGPEVAELDTCLAAGVVRAEGDGVAFRHELARLVLANAVPPTRRRSIHAALLQALASPPQGPPDLARMAHHADEAGDGAAVLEYAPAVARQSGAAGAHREAAAQYARALRYASGLPPRDRAALLTAKADELQLTGRYDAAVGALREAIALYREAGDRYGEGRCLVAVAVPAFRAGRNADGEEASRSAIDVLESLRPTSALATAYATQAYARMISDDNAEGLVWGEKAVALAERFGDQEALAFGLNMIGSCHMMTGDVQRGVDGLQRSIAVAREHGMEPLISSALGMLGTGSAELLEFERSESYLREHIAFAEEHDLWPQYSRSWLALVHVYRGRWDEGTALAEDVLAHQHEPVSRVCALVAIGRVRARRGEPGVDDVLDEALELAEPMGHLQRVGHVRAARAEAAWLAGDPDRTVAEARAVYPLALEKRHLWFAGELAYWQRVGGALTTWPDWVAEPFRLELAGSIDAATAAWASRGCPYEAARAGSASNQERDLLAALTEFDRLGAAPGARIVRHILRELGATVPRGPRPTTRSNPAALTPRELDVLRLVVAEKTNADIAAELVVSPRTVDHHVSAILRKLGVRTRRDAAATGADLITRT